MNFGKCPPGVAKSLLGDLSAKLEQHGHPALPPGLDSLPYQQHPGLPAYRSPDFSNTQQRRGLGSGNWTRLQVPQGHSLSTSQVQASCKDHELQGKVQ